MKTRPSFITKNRWAHLSGHHEVFGGFALRGFDGHHILSGGPVSMVIIYCPAGQPRRSMVCEL